MLSAAEARQTSARNKQQIIDTRERNAAAKRREEAKREAEHSAWWADQIQKDYDTKLAAALKKGLHSFKQNINTLSDNDLSIKDFLKREKDVPVHKKIWRSLRARGYKVEILKKHEFHPEIESCPSDEMPGCDAYHSYEYTARVSW